MDTKTLVMEEFNHTLKECWYMGYCYFLAHNTRSCMNMLPSLLNGDIGSKHRSISMASREFMSDSKGKGMAYTFNTH